MRDQALIEEKIMTAFLCLSTLLFAQLRDPVLSFRASADQGREIVAKLPGDLAVKLPMGRLTPAWCHELHRRLSRRG